MVDAKMKEKMEITRELDKKIHAFDKETIKFTKEAKQEATKKFVADLSPKEKAVLNRRIEDRVKTEKKIAGMPIFREIDKTIAEMDRQMKKDQALASGTVPVKRDALSKIDFTGRGAIAMLVEERQNAENAAMIARMKPRKREAPTAEMVAGIKGQAKKKETVAQKDDK